MIFEDESPHYFNTRHQTFRYYKNGFVEVIAVTSLEDFFGEYEDEGYEF